MSLFTSFSHIQNMSGVCASRLVFSGNTTTDFMVTDTIYNRLLDDGNGNSIQYGYYSWNGVDNATFISGTAPDGGNYAVYMTDYIGSFRYILCPVFRSISGFYRGQGLARLIPNVAPTVGNYNTSFGTSITISARYTGIYQTWDSIQYPRPQLFVTVPSTTQIVVIKYPNPCP